MKGLAAGKAGIDLVPVLDRRFTQTPTKVYRAAIDLAGKIHEAPIQRCLRLRSETRQLLDVPLDLRGERLHFALEPRGLRELLRTGRRGGDLRLLQPLLPHSVLSDEVLHDPTNQGEGSVCAVSRKDFL